MIAKPNPPVILIDGESLTLERAEDIAKGAKIVLANSVKNRMESSQKLVKELAKGSAPIYGINTGFGYLANQRISSNQLQTLQSNIIKSHSGGYGTPLPISETRLAMALRMNVLVKGFTGVRFALCQALMNLITAEIYPIIPECGSVGASGDLAPLAHLALPLLGLGDVYYKGNIVPAKQALQEANLKPIKLVEKEGLSLINGTQIMLAVGGLALTQAKKIIDLADKIAAVTYEGFGGNPNALDPYLHELRGQTGQIESAANILRELEGSSIFDAESKQKHMQDPYSLRCAPQIHGPSRDAIAYSYRIAETELNAVTDNPLVFADQKKIVSGGNFHGQCLAMAFDFASMAISEIANVSERRLELLLNPHMSGLPAFLTPRQGVNSGYMVLQYLSASIVNENKLLANPSCTDSIPGNVGIEDFVSMGMTSARKLKKIVQNVRVVLTAEMLAAAQAIDLRKARNLGQGTRKTYDAVRAVVPKLQNDRIIQEDIKQGLNVLKTLGNLL